MAEYLKKTSGVAKVEQITNSNLHRNSRFCQAEKIIKSLQRPREINSVSRKESQVEIPMGYQPVWRKDNEEEIPTFIVPKLYPQINIRVQLPGSTEAIGTFSFVPEQTTSDSNFTKSAQVDSQVKDEKIGKRPSIGFFKKSFKNLIKRHKDTPKDLGSGSQVGSRGDSASKSGSSNGTQVGVQKESPATLTRNPSQLGARRKELVRELSEEFGSQVREKIDFLIEESRRGSEAISGVETKDSIQGELEKGSWEEISHKTEIMESSTAEELGFELI